MGTTLQTLSICYVSSNVISQCGKRRRRSINIDGLTPKDAAPVDLEPSQREQAMSAPAPPSPPHTRSAVPSALLLVPTFVDRPITAQFVSNVQYILESFLVLQRI